MTHDTSPTLIPVPADWSKRTKIDAAKYAEKYRLSVEDPDAFWADELKRIDWIKAPAEISDVSWSKDDLHIRWFADGVLNACYNCVDRHLPEKQNEVALIWEGDAPSVDKTVTYGQLHDEVRRFSNVLKDMGVKKGDRVTIYLPMIVEAAYAMLACARIGAVHSVVFGGFSPDSIAGRVEDCRSEWVITANEGLRGGKTIPLKANVDKALEKVSGVTGVLVVRHTDAKVAMTDGRDHWYDEAVKNVDLDCPCEPMRAEDPLFILYTSGSTGKPKGVLHTTGGYMVCCLLYTSPSPRDQRGSRMPSSA